MNLPHRTLELPGEAPIVIAELGIGVGLAVRVLGPVFLPQQHQRHAFAAQLLVEAAIVRLDMITWFLRRDQQSPLERDLVSILHRRPVQARRRGEPHILGDNAFGDAQRAGNLLVRKFGVQLQTQYVSYLTHIDPWCGHAVSRRKSWKRTHSVAHMRNIIPAPYNVVPAS
ncbi:hypothetical protein AWB69_04159 [Caballeronia udeis]|uniref:Uncharacterized protein n=1 Tax=Caballeronia udeis TaxID=1232866 RepID=A0A158HB79_9BURK|nr:hypothetical protein AWB69_04159 [Caballeronia udeis]